MKKIRMMTAACLLAGLVLAGCSRQTQFTYEGSRLESMARDLQENAQADSFAKNLEWKNSNQYLNGKSKAPEGVAVIGGKTGTTRAAGSCLILGCQDESGNDYISVVLKAENRDVLYDNMTKIMGKIVN